MTDRARITLSGVDALAVDTVCRQICEISRRTSIGISGPIQLPTKHLKVPVRKGPDGGGTSTIDHWELRIHHRLVDMDADDKAIRQLVRLHVPDGVNIEIELRNSRR